MQDVIKVLNFVKETYEDDSVKEQIDSSIEILKGNEGSRSEKVIDMLRALKIAYDDEDMKVKFDEAIEVLEKAQ